MKSVERKDLFLDGIIELEKICKGISGREVLRDVTFSVGKGDIFGYLGPNGAGKTTTIRIILGLMRADSGRVSILGKSPDNDAARQKIGFLLENDGLYDNLSARDNLLYYARLYDVKEPEKTILDAIKSVGLEDRVKDKTGAFSKGMLQRLALARAMLHNPELLVLDEPTAGVDPSGQIEIRNIMLDMVKNSGSTILLSSHNLDEVQRICNRIAIIDKGTIRISGETAVLQQEMGHGRLSIETLQTISPDTVSELMRIPGVAVSSQQNNLLELELDNSVDASTIVTLLAARGVKIEQVRKKEASLEEIYTTIMEKAGQK